MTHKHAWWLGVIFNHEYLSFHARNIANQIISDNIDLVENGEEKINSIAVSGLSGTVIGGIVSYISGLPLILVRKPGESCHSPRTVEYPDIDDDFYNYAFIDDFIGHGDTLKRVSNYIESESGNDIQYCRCVKAYLYFRNSDIRLAYDHLGTVIPVFSSVYYPEN